MVFHETPQHGSWMNPIEIWWSLLVRRLLKRGSFTSVADLKSKILAFMASSIRTMANPLKRTYQGKALAAYTMDLWRPSCTSRVTGSQASHRRFHSSGGSYRRMANDKS
jgi:hypothetical protein